uniref:Uncharacterized protein n=1 Tax=Tanacetum cinerariifolium TaxID=118510 RepID=A0A6L2KLJ7_TANCI|nr:hypothetical protein [Tanacetum cinerariifolium]
MTKVIKGEFKKLEAIKINDVLLTFNTSPKIFNEEFNQMSRIEDDLFTYEVEIAEARGDDEVELTDEESSDSDDEDEVANIFRIETNVFEFETPLCRSFKEFNYLLQIHPNVLNKDIDGFKTYAEYNDDWIYEWNKDVSWVHERPWMENGWPTCSWREDGYCNGGNLPRAYIVGNILRYQDLEWYDALKDIKLKEEALKNKAIKEEMIDDNDESSNNGWRRWDGYEVADHDQEEREYENDHED